MLQNLQARVSRKLPYALLLCALTTSQTFSQSKRPLSRATRDEPFKIISVPENVTSAPSFVSETISITNNDMSHLTSVYGNEIVIYKVEEKKVKNYSKPVEIAKLEKLDEKYENDKMFNEKLKNSLTHKPAKDPIEEYFRKNEIAIEKNKAVSTIINKIETYQASKEKYKNKKSILDQAQAIAYRYDINIVITELEKVPKGAFANKVKRTLFLYDDKNRIVDEDIEMYKSELQKIPQFEINKPKELVTKELLKEYKNDIVERNAFVINSEPINASSFVGNFKTLYEKYRMCTSTNTYGYVTNELVDEESSNCRNQKKYTVFQNENTKEMFYVATDNFIKKINEYREYEKLKVEFSKYGYSVNENGRVKTKMATVNFGEWLVYKLKENPNYLKQLDSDYSKIAELYKGLPAHSKTLDRFIGLYRIQRRMATSDIDSWRASTQKADNIFRQIYKLKEKYEDRVWDISSSVDTSETYNDFMDNLTVSKHLLGM